jgi:hypothetical protein
MPKLITQSAIAHASPEVRRAEIYDMLSGDNAHLGDLARRIGRAAGLDGELNRRRDTVKAGMDLLLDNLLELRAEASKPNLL